MIIKNTHENVIFHISMSGVSREIIIDFYRKEIRVENLQRLREKGKIFIEGGKSYVFEEIEFNLSLHDYVTSRCDECNLENACWGYDWRTSVLP